MNSSLFDKLRKPNVVVLSAGHGDGDPGAVHGTHQEAKQAVAMVDHIAKLLRDRGVTVDVVPHKHGLKAALKYINDAYDRDEAWAIEIHRDSADGLAADPASWRCGVYHYGSTASTEIAVFLAQTFKRHGAHQTSWARPDTDSRHGRLAWIQQTEPVAHLFELGFMEGANDDAHLLKLAAIAARGIYEAFTGLTWDDKKTAPAATPAVPEDAVAPATPLATSTPAASLLDELAAAVRSTDLAALFAKLGKDVHPEDFDDLRHASLAQWILESGWAKSALAREHCNFGGLKWRAELTGIATPVKYKAWDGWDTYCKFASPAAYVQGYWTFLARPVYDGWEDHAATPQSFIAYLLKCGYTSSDTYLGEVMSLVPKAASLLGGASAAGPGSATAFTPATTASIAATSAVAATIVIDPGHGGTKNLPGASWNNAVAHPSGVLEKAMTFDMAQRIRRALGILAPKIKVLLTRDADVNIAGAARAHVARDNDAGLFLSIHFNGYNKKVHGVETIVRAKKKNPLFDQDVKYAQRIQRAMLDAYAASDAPSPDRGVKEDSESAAGSLAVLARENLGQTVRACLVEMEFIDVPAVDALLNTGASAGVVRDRIAQSLALALIASL